MNIEQITERTIQNTNDIVAMRESLKSAHKRIDENDRITEGIHEIAASVQALALQIKMLTEKLDKNVGKIEESLKRQGERIGAIESVCGSVEQHGKTIDSLNAKVEAIEKEPATKWKNLVAQIIGLGVAAVVGAIFSGFFG